MNFFGNNNMNIADLMKVPQAHLAYCYNPDATPLKEREITLNLGIISVTMTSDEWNKAMDQIIEVQTQLWASRSEKGDFTTESPVFRPSNGDRDALKKANPSHPV